MIKLILTSGNAWYVDPDQIISVGSQQNEERTTYVEIAVSDAVTDYVMTVRESPEEVVQKIMEYRLSLENYRVGAFKETSSLYSLQGAASSKLFKLAGLEE